ncbi:MAG: 16S rRNA (cytidine(1402)-2'-O)-methyltransferase, partial [Pseudomonadota bacterium]
MPDYHIDGHKIVASAPPGGLYVVATPIGNLSDITLRALETLAGADIIACEDTRVSRKLLKRYTIQTPLIAYNEHNAAQIGPSLIEKLQSGQAVALISDAGTPLVSDPGHRLVVDAFAAGIRVVPIPGASAAIAALSASGMPVDNFLFSGFLPSKTSARKKRLEALARIPATLIFYESPNRLGACLVDIAQCLGPQRLVTICREMTKLHEEFVSGNAEALASRYHDEKVKGEIVLLVEPPTDRNEIDTSTLLADLLGEMSVSRAASEAAAITGLPKRELYQLALELAQDR